MVPVRTYPGALSTGPGAFAAGSVGHQILDDYAFSVPYADPDGDARLIALEIEKAGAAAWPFSPCAFDFVEMLEPVFFRSKGAYLVGRVVRGERALPLSSPCSTATTASGSTPCSSPRPRPASSSASPGRTSTSTSRRRPG